MITVVGLGPGDPGLVTSATLAAIAEAPVRYLRTERHPSASLVPDAATFDDIYERADTFADVYAEIVDRLLAAERRFGHVLYAVPGSPRVLERSVAALLELDAHVEVLPALSFLDLAWERLGLDPVERAVRLIDGHRFAEAAAGYAGAMLIAHTHAQWVLSDIKLAIEATDERAIILQGLGTGQERIVEVAWADLDRTLAADHLTCVFVPEVRNPVAVEVVRAVELVARLRRECPWDREQTHESLRRHLLEETYEVLEVLDELEGGRSGDGGHDGAGTDLDRYADLEEELGDLLFQILFHSELATEEGAFDFSDVARHIHDKLVARHPHVFDAADASDAAAVVGMWEQAKKDEKGRRSVLDGIPSALPALALAEKVLSKGARVLPDDVGDDELRHRVELVADSDASLGAALVALVELARRRGLDPEGALRTATSDMANRFRLAERGERDRWMLG